MIKLSHAAKKVLLDGNARVNPWLVHTCGPMGAGKGYVLGWMSAHGHLPLETISILKNFCARLRVVQFRYEAIHQEGGLFSLRMVSSVDQARRQTETCGKLVMCCCHMLLCASDDCVPQRSGSTNQVRSTPITSRGTCPSGQGTWQTKRGCSRQRGP